MYVKAGRAGLNRLLAVAILAIAVLAISGCSDSHPADGPKGREIRVTERDFKIGVTRKAVRPGRVTLAVDNKGPASHELIVVKAKGSNLPLRRNGMTVDEEALEPVIPGALEPEPPGPHRLELRLSPGRYELICNMSGHYFGGMRTRLLVQ
jgi:uncharacterized cupredoxin-like copper-binding protein